LQQESFDIVYASNVLHDTRAITNTLSQVKALLKPGGLLILNEFTAMKDFLLFTGGLLHGYWLFEDPEVRLQDSCLLSVDRWHEVLTTSGFQHLDSLGLPFQETHSRQSVIVCEKDRTVNECSQGSPAMKDQGCTVIIEEAVREIIGQKRMESLSPDMPLMESGLDSMELLDLRMLLSKKFAVDLDATFLFQQNTLEKVSSFFQQDEQPVHHASHLGSIHETAQPENVAFQAPSRKEKNYPKGDIAIIGVALRLPDDVHTLDDFWTLLQAGTTAIGTMPEERWHWLSGLSVAGDKPYLAKGGFLQRIDAFDAAFFRISPREAELLDPQQRLLL
jgi:acyl carrier protein